ncbi:MAG TPA: hydantoinase/oxoprolinase family protein [Gemmatimonadales bacterium]|jgi:probable H4MPT-linked C1 transfer pathway protein|nr:hydantoinase/oxoprolinase family protein [Gemmatimonadales bacterium]
MTNVVGWDIGGVNTKAALIPLQGEAPPRCACLPHAVQREPGALPGVVIAALEAVRGSREDQHAITMTAELSQAFRTKREGVSYILDALEAALPPERLFVYTVHDQFLRPREARTKHLAVAASNWAATAHWIAGTVPTCILIDIGTTSTDLIPIVDGKVAAEGLTDPERLLSGELVYSGALRTPAEAVSAQVPLWGGTSSVSADGFALIGDAHLWLGNLTESEYTCPAPDGRAANRRFAGERLARMVCADRDMLDDPAIDGIATALAGAQVQTLAAALQRIRQRWPSIRLAVVTGLGDFIGTKAADTVGLEVLPLEDRLGPAARVAPAFAVAGLLRNWLNHR